MRRLTAATKIDIGCAKNTRVGYTGIDRQDFGQEIVWDVREGLPFADGTITDIYMSHFLEHLDNKDIQDFFIEIYRVCRNDARVEIIVPHKESEEAYTHNHLTFWDEKRIRGLAKGFYDERFRAEDLRISNTHSYKELYATLIIIKRTN